MKGLTDIPGITAGHASDFDAITGCTVVLCGKGAVGGVDVRGSATGTQELDVLSPGHVTPLVHSIVLAGGSAFGLEAASGVRGFLEKRGVGYPVGAGVVPIVAGAILYDLGLGKPHPRPTREMGEAAAAAAHDGPVQEGSIGAGTGATIGKMFGMARATKAGIGSFTVEMQGRYAGVKVAALVAVNAVGDVRDPATGKLIAGARRSAESSELVDSEAEIIRGAVTPRTPSRENTTLAIVATNARLNKVQATKLAQMAQIGMARTIWPVNTMSDGDIVFALSLGEAQADVTALGVAAAHAVAEAILRSVRTAKTLGGVPAMSR